MQLRRIEVRNFRRLSHRVIDGLGDGLHVIVGDNEAGKSTLLAALRAVLFERHRVGGRVLDAMLPHGHDVRPEILLDFSLKGELFRLRKAFNQRPEAELELPGGQRITGDAVEEQLGRLLGFQPPGSRGSKPDEHQGVHGLLWVEQGLSHETPKAGAGHDTLSSALESEVGLVLGGERGRRLLARAEERRDAFWDKRDRPRGTYRQVQDRIGTLEGELAGLEKRIRRHDEQVAALTAKQDILSRYRRDDRLGLAARAVETARAAAGRIDQLAATLDELRRAQARAAFERDTAAERLRARRLLAGRVDAAEPAAAKAEAEAGDAQAQMRRAEEVWRGSLQARGSARDDRGRLEAQLAGLERAVARARARDSFARASATLAEAEAVAAKRRDALGVVATVLVTKADLAELDRAVAEHERARSRRDVASVQITADPDAGGTIAVDGVPHPGNAPLLLARDAVLDLPGFGRLRVRPGGGAEALAAAVDEAAAQVRTVLKRLGCADRPQAAAALARRAEAEIEAVSLQRLFAHLAPGGLDALRQDVDALRVEAAADGEDDGAPAALPDRATLRQALEVSRLAEAGADDEVARADAGRQSLAQRCAALAERVAATAREVDAATAALADARAVLTDDRLERALAEAERGATLAGEATAVAVAALANADPETAALVLKRAENAEKAIRADMETLTRDKRDLDVELRTLGQEGLGEHFAEAEGQIATARRQLAAQTLEAAASRLLHATLTQAQRDTKDRWLGPVRERVTPYLRLLQPDSEIVLNERTFAIEHLVRAGVAEPFESLSIGAREQVAVITRLALADILRGSGHPAAIILDDALTNTDEGRLDRMHLVLQRAAANLQVLVLTCRERDFLALGAPIHRL